MSDAARHRSESAARVLSLVAVANGRVKACELHALERLGAFARLGVSRRRFLNLAQTSLDDVGGRMSERGHLHVADLLHLDHLLSEVRDRDQRALVRRMAAAVITADGRVTPDERTVYDHLVARWHLDLRTVAEVIRVGAVF